tara:strand:+ start:417788 stop:418651 length:864 start_codon:yes stop_codon:yes gene_type:complete
MQTVAIIGHGYVGQAMTGFFRDHYNLVVVDTKFAGDIVEGQVGGTDPICTFTKDYRAANGADLVVVCLPTPRDEKGFCDTSLVEEALRTIEAPFFIIKSTVEPGTTKKLQEETGKNIVFAPEFAGESRYWTEYKFHTDVKETPWFVFGGEPEWTEKAVQFYIKVAGPTKTYHQTDCTTAELVKYIENTFFAMKVAFCYEVDQVCKTFGVDYYKLRTAWLLDPRLSPMHTAVFEESEKPFGGKCFPKDVSAIVEASSANGYEPELLREILKSNERIGEIRREQHAKKQ